MTPRVPARWAIPIGMALALLIGGIETYVSLAPWAHYAIGAVGTMAGIFGIEAPGQAPAPAKTTTPTPWP